MGGLIGKSRTGAFPPDRPHFVAFTEPFLPQHKVRFDQQRGFSMNHPTPLVDFSGRWSNAVARVGTEGVVCPEKQASDMTPLPTLTLALALSHLLALPSATAHPGVGLVEDSGGNIFYTDLVHIWKISPEGRKTIAVRNVHTHELALDAQDNLYGEDLVYEGEALNRWHHRIWKCSPDGKVTDLFGQRSGFREDYGFARDRRGTQYWLQYEENTTLIRKRTPEGKVTTIHPKTPFPRLTWLAVSQDGSALYVTTSNSLHRISSSGAVTPLIHHESTNRHALMGIWPAADGSVYAADFASRTINRVETNGRITLVARTENPWAPSSMLRTRDGILWILDYSTTNEARLRRIDKAGKSRVF